MARILIVDDEPEIVRLVVDYMSAAGFGTATGRTGDEAVMRAQAEPPDLVILDLGLPGLDGLDVTRTLRRTSDVPIIMLTARDDETDKLIGLELGADDYVTKPFSPRELVARVKTVIRRSTAPAGPRVVRDGAVSLDPSSRTLTVEGTVRHLTTTEFNLLEEIGRAHV